MKLEDVLTALKFDFNWVGNAFIEGGEIIIEQDYNMGEDEKNDDDCYDVARENGEIIIEKYPSLEISNYYCHRHKYAVTCLKLI